MYWDYWTPQIDRTVMPWSAEIGNLGDFSYFNAPSLWLSMQSQYAPYQMPDYSINYQQAYNQGANLMRQMNFSSSLSNTSSSITKFKSQIESILNSDNISEDKKTLFREMLEQIKMLEEQLKLVKNMAPNGNLDELEKALNDINTDLSDLKNIATEIIQAAEEEAQQLTEELQNSQNNEGTGQTGSNEETSSSSSASSENKPTKNPRKEAQDICKDIYVAIKGWGTNEKKLDEAIGKINEDNVIEVMDKWQLDYLDSKIVKGDDSFLESLFDDVGSKRQKKYTKIILDALQKRADNEKIDISHLVAIIEHEIEHGLDKRTVCKTMFKIWEMLTKADTGSRLEAVA